MNLRPARCAPAQLLRTTLVLAVLLAGAGRALAQGRGAPPPAPPKATSTPPKTKSTPPKTKGVPGGPAPRQDREAPPATDAEAGPPPGFVLVRRLSDVVAVREGERSSERVLYYFNPDVNLAEGDHVEQGSGGQSELLLPGGAKLSLHATAHVELARISAGGDELHLPLLTRLDMQVLERPLVLILPGGTEVQAHACTLRVEVEPGRMQIRNDGNGSFTVVGDLRLERSGTASPERGKLEVRGGEQVTIPLFDVMGDDTGTITDLWGALTVRHTRGVELQPDGDLLRIAHGNPAAEPAGPAPGAADAAAKPEQGAAEEAPPLQAAEEVSLGGVTTKLPPGAQLVILDTHHVNLPASPPPADEPGGEVPKAAEPPDSTGAPKPPINAPEPKDGAAPAPATGGSAPTPKDKPAPPAPPSGTPKQTIVKEKRS